MRAKLLALKVMRPPAILFDAGHTLIEPNDEALAEAAAAAHLAASPREIAGSFREAICALNRVESVESVESTEQATTFRDFVSAGLDRLGLRSPSAELAFWAVLDRYNNARQLWTKPIAGASDTLAALRARGIRLGIVSNSDGYVEHYLLRAGLLPFLEVIVDSHVVGVEKPDARIFRYALDRLGMFPSSIPFIGDRYDVDVLGSRAVGLRPILYNPTGGATPNGCEVVGRLGELLDLVG